VNQEAVQYMSTKLNHQTVVEFLAALLKAFVQLLNLGTVHTGPYTMRLPNGNAREPDVFFVSAAKASFLTESELQTPADLVIEVISDDSVARDRDTKFFEYQSAEVQEYWVIDPRPSRLRADFFVLDANGQYVPVVATDGVFHSTVLPKFWLRVSWLWQEQPNALKALAEIVGIDRLLDSLKP
jgi:Uma2 family endonuclease